MDNVERERQVLTHATMLAGALLKADTDIRKEMLPKLEAQKIEVQATQLKAHANLKRLVILTVNAAIRYCVSSKSSDAKLTRRHGNEVAKELARLKRLAQREERG